MPRPEPLAEVVSYYEEIGDGGAITEVFAEPEEPTDVPDEGMEMTQEARDRLKAFEADAERRLTEPGKALVLMEGFDESMVQRRSHGDIQAMKDDVISAPWGTSMHGKDEDAAEITLPDAGSTE